MEEAHGGTILIGAREALVVDRVEFTSSLGSFYTYNSTSPGSGIKDAYVPSLERCLVGTGDPRGEPACGGSEG